MMPALRPVTIASLFFITPATIGTKGGELMNDTEEMTIESASTLKSRHTRAWRRSDTKTANDIKPMRLRPLRRSRVEKSAIEAMARLNIYIRYRPMS